MAIKIHETTLTNRDNISVKVIVSDFPARQGARLGANLLRILASFIKAAPKDSKTDNRNFLERDIDFTQLSQALVDNLEETKILSLILNLVTFTRVDGQEISREEIFDTVFAGDYGLLFAILKFILEVNFKSFFGNKDIGKALSSLPPISLTRP